MILKIDVTSQCNLANLPEVKRVINCYQATEGERTFCCSASPSIYCEDLGCQLDFHEGTSQERMEEIEQMFYGEYYNCYYGFYFVKNLPEIFWGELPPEGSPGGKIDTSSYKFECRDDEIEAFFAECG